MPTYEYECKKCNYHFEVFQSISDEALKVCPQCGKEVRRLIFGGAGVIFKGSGFYVTDKSKGPDAKAPATQKTAETSSGTARNTSVSSKTGDVQKAAAPAGNSANAGAAPANAKPKVKTA
jgi:putative FmdB family regulatory protein